ncbi:MAG: hypothetical protein RLZ92_466, partial [Pseudomonadota bacterium]
MKVQVNGDSREYGDNCTVADVIADLGLTGKRIAVELNMEILPFTEHATQTVKDGDRLEIVQAIGGGQDDYFTLAGTQY